MTTLGELNERARELDRAADYLRYVRVRAKHWDNWPAAHAEAEQKYGPGSAVCRLIKTAVSAVNTTTESDLVRDRAATAAWVSILSKRTIAGRIPFPKVGFRTRTLTESSPGSAAWVEEGAPIPVSKLNLDATSLEHHRISGMFALTDETLESDNADNLQRINTSFLSVIGRVQDRQMLDPDVAAVTAKNPASLTNGVSATVSTGSTEAAITSNIKTMLQVQVDAGADLNDVVIVMHPTTALHMSGLLTAGNIRAYPNLGVRGGEIFGLPVLTSVGAVCSGSPSERVLAAINPPGCLLADEGELEITPSKQAAIQLLDNPTNQSTSTTTATNLVSLFQTGATAIRFSRWISWQRGITDAVSFMRVTY